MLPMICWPLDIGLHRKNAGLLLGAWLSVVPAMAASTDWTFDASFGFATRTGMPAGQLALTRDGMGYEARTITYTSTDNATSITIERAYGPRGHKATESENGSLRQHVYGTGLAPVMRAESDGSITYQAGLETLSVPASGAVTVAHRVVDFKDSTVAVLGRQVVQQRAGYTAFGSMRLEQPGTAATDAYTNAVLLAGYEGLSAWQLGSDQLVDNRARLYDAASGRFLALDGAGQALAYEARSNDPVSRVDIDGNVDFEKLVNAVQEDPTIPVIFGEQHSRPLSVIGLIGFVLKLWDRKIKFRIYQESNLLSATQNGMETIRDFHQGKPYTAAIQFLMQRDLIDSIQLEDAVELVSERDRTRINQLHGDSKNLPVVKPAFEKWETNIPIILNKMRNERTVAIFFVGASHIVPLSNQPEKLAVDASFRSIVVPYWLPPDIKSLLLISTSSLDLQSKWNMVSVVPYETSKRYARYANSYYFTEQILSSHLDYSIRIPFKVFARHKALAGQYAGSYPFPLYFMPKKHPEFESSESDEKKDETDEKNDDTQMNQHRAASLRPMSNPESGDSIKKEYFKE